MTEALKPKILFVDDESHLLDGIVRLLRPNYQVTTASSGAAGLELLKAEIFNVIVSDLRMPGMDGVSFLGKVKEAHPDSVCLLLTGNADLEAAISAVNSGAVFRFLTKPCPPDVLVKSLQAAVHQHQLITAEKVLLEQTLRGSIKALTEILSMTNPVAFGRANRVKEYVKHMAPKIGITKEWEVEIAAMLSQIGGVIVPNETLKKYYAGDALKDSEDTMIARMPEVGTKLIAHIPRLESVASMLYYQDKEFDGGGKPMDKVKGTDIPLGARLLKVLLDFDLLESQKFPAKWVLEQMKKRSNRYDPTVLREFSEFIDRYKKHSAILELPLKALETGMVLEADVITRKHILLVPRGSEVTPALLERLQNFAKHHEIQEPIQVKDKPKPVV